MVHLLKLFVVSSLFLLSCLIFRILYNLFYHPLSRFPGPKLWAVARWPYMRAMLRGTLVHRIHEFHERYGEMIRIGPDEISCINPAAWQDVYGHQPSTNFPKNPLWISRKSNDSSSILSASDTNHHRIRKLISSAFSEKALREQEPILQAYVDTLIHRLQDQVKAGWGHTVVDMVKWYSWTTFDIIGELGFGETFGCLTDSSCHSWSSMVFNHFKAASFVTSTRFYPLFEKLMRKFLPAAVMKRRDHFQSSKEKIHRRLERGAKSVDIMSYVLDPNAKGSMSIQEIETTFNILIIAGSETTASALAGTTNYLLKNPGTLAKLVREIRSNYEIESEINLSTLATLPYLTAVIEEGLRMAPPVPSGLPRVVPKGGGTVCGKWLPEGTSISFAQWAAYRSPLNFIKPNEFMPERWLQSDNSLFDADRKKALQPFSSGPRNCIGKNLAYAELRLIIARLLWNFDLSLPKEPEASTDWTKQLTYVLVEKAPLYVQLKSRFVPLKLRHRLVSQQRQSWDFGNSN